MIDLEKARSHLEELGLLSAVAFLDALLERAQRENSTYLDFLMICLKLNLPKGKGEMSR